MILGWRRASSREFPSLTQCCSIGAQLPPVTPSGRTTLIENANDGEFLPNRAPLGSSTWRANG
jgi:hypothetical protein